MSETPLANDASARDSAGTIVDQAQSGTDAPKTETITTPTETPTETPKSESTETPKEGETLLTSDAKAPEKYADFKLPEGIKLDGEQLTAATVLFKESGLSQDAAQKMVDFHVAQMKAAVEGVDKGIETMRADWQAKTKADPDIAKIANDGKVGLDAVKVNVAKVYNALGDQKLVGEFKELMNLTGVGDNPAFIKVLNKLSEFVVEGKHVAGGGPSTHGQNPGGNAQKPTAAQAMYPSLPSSARS